MQVRAVAKNVHIAPRKVRLLLAHLPGKGVDEALAILRYTPRPSARTVAKVVHSAAANAENNYALDRRRLHIAAAYADPAMTLERYRARARGRSSVIKKRHSHITIVVEDR